jgi:hypothetical protein
VRWKILVEALCSAAEWQDATIIIINFHKMVIWRYQTKCFLQVFYWFVGCMFTKIQSDRNMLSWQIAKNKTGKCTLLSTHAPKSAKHPLRVCALKKSQLKVISPSNKEHCSCHYLWHLMHYVQSSVLRSSYLSPHPGQKMFLLLSWIRWLSNSRPNVEFLSPSFC